MEGAVARKVASEPPEDTGDQTLVNCNNCGRHFAVNRIAKHETICKKQKKRKPFDVCLQRVRGTDAEKFFKKSRNNRNKQEKTKPAQPVKSWRVQHEEFIQSMRAAREATAILKKGGNLRDLPPAPPLDYSDFIQCPHCSRKFNTSAAERHIPKCAEMQHNKPKPSPPKNVLSKQGTNRVRK